AYELGESATPVVGQRLDARQIPVIRLREEMDLVVDCGEMLLQGADRDPLKVEGSFYRLPAIDALQAKRPGQRIVDQLEVGGGRPARGIADDASLEEPRGGGIIAGGQIDQVGVGRLAKPATWT